MEMKLIDAKVGSVFSGILYIKNVSKGETKTGSPYLFVKIGDITGEVLLKIWSVEKELEEILISKGIGNFVKLENLNVGQYKGNLEITSQAGSGVSFIERQVMEKDPTFNIIDYTVGSPYTSEEMMQSIIHDIRFEITDLDTKRLVATIFEKYKDEFEISPAAISMHHDYENGLLYHTFNMLRVGKSIVEFYPQVNKSLLIGGIILHDMGKIIEYKESEESNSYEFSVRGNLLGHISMMSSEIEKTGRELSINDEVILNLQHLVLSHHGKKEWGSPVEPKTPEAIMLHHIDNLDAKMEQVRSNTIGFKKGETTGRVFGLGNNSLYIPNMEDEI